MSNKKELSRLDFLKMSAVGAGVLMIPSSLSAAVSNTIKKEKKESANQINLGFIGLGQQANYLVNGFLTIEGVKVIAGCDVYDIKNERFEKKVKDFYSKKGVKSALTMYHDYKELLANPNIDAVVIATPDHWHAVIAVAACKAGKDVYLEKPMTFTIPEGRALCTAVRQNNRILQVGSQQRSSDEFIHAATLVREGKLGKITRISACVGDGPKAYDLPQQEIPAGLDWDRWLGPLSTPFHYNAELDPLISIDPPKNEEYWGAWRWYKGMGGGYTTDWGAHMFDIAQWMLGKDLTAPVKIIPPGYAHYKDLTFVYDNGIELVQEKVKGDHKCVKVYGEKGWVYVERGHFECSNPEWEMKKQTDDSVPFETKVSHHKKFIDAVRTRVDPNVPVEVGHSSATVCSLGNIAYELGRPLDWNPIVEKFVDDPEATAMLQYKYRDGYSL
ncbi:MAG: Gfo/Idh/MocA family oxidoreductase [Rikenellaceae bacterium]